MNKKDVFGILENAENESMERLIDKCPEITDEQLGRILKMSEKKNKERKKDMNKGITMTSNDSIDGVERSNRPAWMSGLSIAASLILIVGIIAGSTVLMKNGRVDHGGEEIPPAVTVTTATGTGTTQAASGTAKSTGTETTAVKDTAVTNSSGQTAVSSANAASTEADTTTKAADTANAEIKPFAGTWICQDSSCGIYPVTEGARDLGMVYINEDSTYRYIDRNGSESAGTVSVRSYEMFGNEFTELRFSGELSGKSTFQYAHTESSDELYNGNGGMARIIRVSGDRTLTEYGWKNVYKSVVSHFSKSTDADAKSYNVQDIDGDGIPELFISEGLDRESGVSIYYYDSNEDKAVAVNGEYLNHGSTGTAMISPEEHLIFLGDDARDYSNLYYYSYVNRSLRLEKKISEITEGENGARISTYYINDEPVSEAEYAEASRSFDDYHWMMIDIEHNYKLSDTSALED